MDRTLFRQVSANVSYPLNRETILIILYCIILYYINGDITDLVQYCPFSYK